MLLLGSPGSMVPCLRRWEQSVSTENSKKHHHAMYMAAFLVRPSPPKPTRAGDSSDSSHAANSRRTAVFPRSAKAFRAVRDSSRICESSGLPC